MSDDLGGNENAAPCQMPSTMDINDLSTIPMAYDKSQSLVDIANNTFKELCRTLENEQSKLLELEERRKKLQEEMQRLKMEIEEERHTYRLHLDESEKSSSECKLGECESDAGMAISQKQSQLETCYEDNEKTLDDEKSSSMSVSQQSEAASPITGCSETDCSVLHVDTVEPPSQAVVEEGQNESKM